MSQHVNRNPEPLLASLPRSDKLSRLDPIILKCLAKHPEDRFKSAAQLSQQLSLLRLSDRPARSRANVLLMIAFVLIALVTIAAIERERIIAPLIGSIRDLQADNQSAISELERQSETLEQQGNLQEAFNSARKCVKYAQEKYGASSLETATALNRVAALANKTPRRGHIQKGSEFGIDDHRAEGEQAAGSQVDC